MATSFDTNLGIQSVLGFKRPSGVDTSTGYVFQAPRPVMQTTLTLNGETFADTGINTATRVLIVDPLDTFQITQGNTSTDQTVVIRNFGNAMVTITNVSFSINGAIPVPKFSTATLTTGKIEVAPGSSATFELAYFSINPGTHANTFLLTSNIDTTFTRVWSYQSVGRKYSLSADSDTITSTSTQYGERVRQTFSLTPIVNLKPAPGLVVPLDATITSSSPGWSIYSIDLNQETGKYDVVVEFKTLDVASSTGTYTAEVVAESTYQGITTYNTSTSVVDVNVDFSQFQNKGSWISPAAAYNSVIGMSYDRIGSNDYLTIGVGTGGDGTPEYGLGGYIYTSTQTLNYLATVTDYPYAGWATVYRFPVSDIEPAKYFSGADDGEGNFIYKKKSTDGQNYEEYFGTDYTVGSMFIVEVDGNGNVEVNMNQLRELSGNTDYDSTLKNLTRAFYYYSTSDSITRYYQLDSGPALDGSVTRLFRGFDGSGTVITSLVNLPRSF